jgi:hypothetical protein
MHSSPKPVETPIESLLRLLAANEARRLLSNAARPFRSPIDPEDVTDLRVIKKSEKNNTRDL